MTSDRRLRLAALGAALGLAAGCSGGGTDDGAQTATLTLSMMDAPVDDVTEVHVEITAIWLKAAGDDEPPFEVPLTAAPMTVDLLAHTDENAALLVDGATIEAGAYEWLAMDVSAAIDNVYDSYVKTDTGGMEEIFVPSSRVRLVDGFEIGPNQAVQLLFDWDLRKGLVYPPGLAGFLLKPAFRVIDVTEYGVIAGTIAMGTVTHVDNDCNADTPELAPDYDVGNAVYVYAGLGVDPYDIDGEDPEPVATVNAVLNSDKTAYEYRVLLPPGDYTVAFTCQAANDLGDSTQTPDTDPPFAFVAHEDVPLAAETEATVDF